jgi:hypothetical protein
MIKSRIIWTAVLGLLAAPLQADVFGLANGRSANMDNMADMSIEAGTTLESDLTTYGLRFNYKLSPDMMVFGDLGLSEFGSADGMSFGAGVYYQLRGTSLLENTDTAVKLSYHSANLEIDGCTSNAFFDCDFSASSLAIEGLISGDQLAETQFGWYGNVGIHMIDVGSADDTEFGFGFGITGDTSFGQFYAGIDMIDELFLVGGVRYHLQ